LPGLLHDVQVDGHRVVVVAKDLRWALGVCQQIALRKQAIGESFLRLDVRRIFPRQLFKELRGAIKVDFRLVETRQTNETKRERTMISCRLPAVQHIERVLAHQPLIDAATIRSARFKALRSSSTDARTSPELASIFAGEATA